MHRETDTVPVAREIPAGIELPKNPFTEKVWEELGPKRDATAEVSLDTKTSNFKKLNHLDVEKDGDSFKYTLKANGKDNVLFTTKATLDGLKEAQGKVDKLVDSKQVELTKKYKVEFSAENEYVMKQYVEHANCTVTKAGDIHARRPNLHELAGIESGIERAAPTHLSADGKQGLKVYFLKDSYYKGDAAIAYYIEKDKNSRTALYFDPGETDGIPATEKDAQAKKYHVDGRLIDSIAAVVVHECAHNEQNNRELEKPANYAKLSKEIGWVGYVDPADKATKYLLEGKDGTLYKFHQDDCSKPKTWLISDKEGHPLDKSGKPTTDSKKYQTLTKWELQDKAKHRPATIYFNNLYEEHAEAATAFRLDADNRGNLLKTSPTIYNAVKRWDDDAIATAYGSDSKNQPNKMRSPSGPIVDNNEANRKALTEWEEKFTPKKK